MKTSFQLNKIAVALTVMGGVTLFSGQAMAATPLAGTNISNVATASYSDDTGTVRVVTSNEVKTLVAQVGSFTLEADRSATTVPNGQVTMPHILTNTGNGTDKFTLGLENLAGGGFDFASGKYAIYEDKNKDGVPDNSDNLMGKTIELQAGESRGLVVVATTPSTAAVGTQDQLKLVATASTTAIYAANADKASNTDTVTITGGAVIQITKAASVSAAKVGEEIEYTLTFKNTGNAVATNVAIFDVLPANVEYVAKSAFYSGSSAVLTEDADTKDNYQFDTTNKRLLLTLPRLETNNTGTLKFKVKVLSTTASEIKNTAYADPDGKPNPKFDPDQPVGPGNTPTIPLEPTDTPTSPNTPPTQDPSDKTTPSTPSNPSIVTVAGTYDASINDSATDSFKDGETSTDGDDRISVAGKQGLPVVFGDSNTDPVVVHNRGNRVDTYNITYTKPNDVLVEILKADGSTPLTDTNNDGIIDTGPIEPGQKQNLVVRVTLPNGDTYVTSGLDVLLTSTSVANAGKDTLTLNVSGLTANKVDLVNRPGTDPKDSSNDKGVGKGTSDSVEKKTTAPGTPAIFDATIKNEGNIPDNYNITVPGIPEDWTVEIFEKDDKGNCTSTKATNSGNIKPNESASFCVVVTPPAGTPAGTNKDIKVEISSPSTGTHDDITFDVVVDEQRKLTFTPDRQGQIAPGGTIEYKHVLTNQGNVTEGYKDLKDPTQNKYLLEIDWSSTLVGGNTSIYVDWNNDGVLATNELITGETDAERNQSLNDLLAKTGSAGLSQNESVNIIVKVEAPATATAGQSDTTIVTFKPTGDNKPAAVSITDVTTINLGQIRLVKTQAFSSDCTTVPAESTYTSANITAKPGECVYYRIVATNEGNADAESVVITDMVPSYTTYVDGSVKPTTGTTAPSASNKNVKYDVGTLQPTNTATLEFGVKVDK